MKDFRQAVRGVMHPVVDHRFEHVGGDLWGVLLDSIATPRRMPAALNAENTKRMGSSSLALELSVSALRPMIAARRRSVSGPVFEVMEKDFPTPTFKTSVKATGK